MKTKHTPGPWHIWQIKEPGQDQEIFILEDMNDVICEIKPSQGGEKEDLKNAAIIANAPEMLAALKILLARCACPDDDECHDCALMEQVIAKAEGK